MWWDLTRNVDKTQRLAAQPKTIIGVVGQTGAGKSSLINAILDEQRLAPTSGMKACTAAPTEISYNYEHEGYRAEITFLSKEEWTQDLTLALEDMFDPSEEISSERSNLDTDVGRACAKVHAVYPELTREEMAKSGVEYMFKKVEKVLEESLSIREESAFALHRKIQPYISSADKTAKFNPSAKDTKGEGMALWPLVKVVKIFVRSAALSHGAILVDLPGIEDKNAARATIAQEYLKRCTSIWIVTAIHRATSDKISNKIAYTLLSDDFRRQRILDNSMDTISIICTKIGDIDPEEALDIPHIQEQASSLQQRLLDYQLQEQGLIEVLEDVRNGNIKESESLKHYNDQFVMWAESSTRLFFQPQEVSGKRKNLAVDSETRKKSRLETAASINTPEPQNEDPSFETQGDDANAFRQNSGCPSADYASCQYRKFRTLRSEAKEVHSKGLQRLARLKEEIEQSRIRQEELRHKLYSFCVRERNKYVHQVIQQDYESGFSAFYKKQAEKSNSLGIKRETDERLAQVHGVNVFCTSARAYQKLNGRFDKNKIQGFDSIQETGIPSLQDHVASLTQNGRCSKCLQFLTRFERQCISLKLWVSEGGKRVVEETARIDLENNMQRALRELQQVGLICLKPI